MATRAEHLLACLAEECCEVGQTANKAIRFDLDDDLVTEGYLRHHLECEVCDLLGVIELLQDEGLLPRDLSKINIQQKKFKVQRLMEYAEKKGFLEGGQTDG